MISKEQVYEVHWFYYFPCSWISFPCLYLDNNCLASFFIVCSVKVLYVLWWNQFHDSNYCEHLQINQNEKCWILLLLKVCCLQCVLSLSYHWLNYCKVFWWLYYVDTKYIVFVGFRFLVCMNSLQLLFVLVILEALLIVCSELRVLFHFLFFDFLIFPLSVFYFFHSFFYIFSFSHFSFTLSAIVWWYCICFFNHFNLIHHLLNICLVYSILSCQKFHSVQQ